MVPGHDSIVGKVNPADVASNSEYVYSSSQSHWHSSGHGVKSPPWKANTTVSQWHVQKIQLDSIRGWNISLGETCGCVPQNCIAMHHEYTYRHPRVVCVSITVFYCFMISRHVGGYGPGKLRHTYSQMERVTSIPSDVTRYIVTCGNKSKVLWHLFISHSERKRKSLWKKLLPCTYTAT